MSAVASKQQFLLTQHACPAGLSPQVFDAIREFGWLVALGQAEKAQANLTSFLDDFEVYDCLAQEHSIFYGLKNIPAFFIATKKGELSICIQEIYEHFLELGVPNLDDFEQRFFKEDHGLIDDLYESEYVIMDVAKALQEFLYGFQYQDEKDKEAQHLAQNSSQCDESADNDQEDEENREIELCFWINLDGIVGYFLIKYADHGRLKVLIEQMGCGKGSRQMVSSADFFPSL